MILKFMVLITLIILNFVVSVELYNVPEQGVVMRLNRKQAVEGNIQNLFRSIVKNDFRAKDTYQEILENNMKENQQVFNNMKNEIASARRRNGEKLFLKQKRNVMVAKRQINEKTYPEGGINRQDLVPDFTSDVASDSAPDSAPEPVLAPASESRGDHSLSSSSESGPELVLSDPTPNDTVEYDLSESGPKPVLNMRVHKPLENLYMVYYGNNPLVERCWTPLRELNSDEDEGKMKEVCIEYHKLANKGSLKASQIQVTFNKHLLRFRTNSDYRSVYVDVLWYSVNDSKAVEIEDLQHFYITRGMGADCVFYLTPTDKTCMEFYLEEHICKNNPAMFKWNRNLHQTHTNKKGRKKNKVTKTSSESVEETNNSSDDSAAEENDYEDSPEEVTTKSKKSKTKAEGKKKKDTKLPKPSKTEKNVGKSNADGEPKKNTT